MAALELFEENDFKREEPLSVQSSSDENYFLAALDHYEQKLLGATGPVKEDEDFLVNYGQEVKTGLPCLSTRFGPPVSEEIISKGGYHP